MATYDINLNTTVKQNITNLLKQNQPSLVNLKSNMFDITTRKILTPTESTANKYFNSDGKEVFPTISATIVGVEYYGGTGTNNLYWWTDDLAKFKNYPSMIGSQASPVKIATVSEITGKLFSTHSEVKALDICNFLGIHKVCANFITVTNSTNYTTFAFNTGAVNFSTVKFNDLETTGASLLYTLSTSFNVYIGD